jgi:cytochrome c oxidase cbb3-type subunit 1
MSIDETKSFSATANDVSCRVPLLALFGGAALWLVLGLLLGLLAAMSFHDPNLFGNCPFLTFGRAQAAANDLVLYGFVMPAALGTMLWIATRLSGAPLALPIVPVAAANLWHLGVAIGTLEILTGGSSGHAWLEYPRLAACLLFAGFILMAVSATATMGFRARGEMYPSLWFFLAALLWFAWTYSTANLFLISSHPPRGVAQAVIDWWYSNNLLFVWLSLAGIGIAFYFLPKFAARPLAGTGYALFAFLTLIGFGTWCGMPQGAPVPAWLPAVSAYAALLSILPVIAVAVIGWKTAAPAGFSLCGGPFCFMKFGLLSLVVSDLLYLSEFCPRISRVVDLTWFGFGVTQWQLLGAAGMIVCGAIYEILPRVMEKELPQRGLAKLSAFLFAIGVLVYVVPLLIGGVEQGMKLNANIPFADISAGTLMFLRISSTGQLLMIIASLCLLLNVLIMTIQWKLALGKALVAALTAPLSTDSTTAKESEVKP